MERRRASKTGEQKRTKRAPADEVQREVERGQHTRPWQRYLDAELGLRNYWYPVLFSHELPEGEVRAATLLGERLFFKRIKGQVYGVGRSRVRSQKGLTILMPLPVSGHTMPMPTKTGGIGSGCSNPTTLSCSGACWCLGTPMVFRSAATGRRWRPRTRK